MVCCGFSALLYALCALRFAPCLPRAPCSLHYAPSALRHALCALRFALCPLLYAPANPEPDCLNEPKEPNGPNDIKEPYRLDQLLP